jgi:hypothetical protein
MHPEHNVFEETNMAAAPPRDAPTLDTLVIEREVVDRTLSWVRCPPAKGILVLWHPLGCGVSTMLRLIEHNVQDSTAFVWDVPTRGAGGGSRHTVLGQTKIVVVDDVDHYFGTDQNHTKKLLSCLEKRPLPIVVAGGHRRVTRAKVTKLLRRSTDDVVIEVPPPSLEAIDRVLRPLGVVDPQGVLERCGGDFRHAYEWTVNGQQGHTKDVVLDGLPALEYLLRHPDASSIPEMPYRDVSRMVDGDASMLVDGTFENYLHARGLGGHSSDPLDAAASVLDILEQCDVMHSRVYLDPSTEWPEVAACLAAVRFIVTPGTTAPGAKSIKTFGSVWANTNHMYARKNYVRRLGVAGGSRPRDLEELQHMRHMLLADMSGQAPRMLRLLGDDDTALWHMVSQVWKSSRSGQRCTKAALVAAARPSTRRASKRPLSPDRN